MFVDTVVVHTFPGVSLPNIFAVFPMIFLLFSNTYAQAGALSAMTTLLDIVGFDVTNSPLVLAGALSAMTTLLDIVGFHVTNSPPVTASTTS